MKTSFAIAALIAPVMTLGACSSDVRLSVPEVPSEVRANSSYPSLEVRLVSLPTYAGEETVATQNADGTITANAGLLWADDPARSLTMALARQLTQITGATVAPEPWPFDAYPAGRVDIRFSDLLAQADGTLLLAGQYFVVDSEGRGRDRARLFRITETIDGTGSPADIARARSAALAKLAEEIVQNGL
ncbi:PqiC family protein [Donghicola tyrosinivorans]|uniref:ABC-type transport auxiliary lipoprotein component domain-containing protein n=1 Tax=Donghicola tyrosinivorans TaxID=1652492 RepID=A0A2T0X5L7_9RHOB|nr:PqiC family protein [Donghicola tyrosinivorans]PRY94185.1 hypothetical protein CLV74_101321 [Donghicola tyrosinivorans]